MQYPTFIQVLLIPSNLRINNNYINTKEIIVNTILFERYQQAKKENKGKYTRNLADLLNVSEAKILHSRVGKDGSQRLSANIPDLLQALSTIGEVKAITRNEFAISQQIGQYDNAKFSSHAGLFLNPRGLDLRMFFAQWDSVFALNENISNGEHHSIQFFDKHGDALHKVYATEHTDMSAWNALIKQYATEHNPELIINKVQPFSEQPINEALAQQLEQQWRSMTDVHQFFILLKNNNLSRQQVFRAVSDELAWQVPINSLSQLLSIAYEQQNEIMLFVGNRGCVQIFTGLIERLSPLFEEDSGINWLNVFNSNFTLHMIENGVTECWVTQKPTQDGFVTSLEVFDRNGNQIIQMYGQRTEGEPEQKIWRDQILSLPKI